MRLVCVNLISKAEARIFTLFLKKKLSIKGSFVDFIESKLRYTSYIPFKIL